jgi:hypothetical protein
MCENASGSRRVYEYMYKGTSSEVFEYSTSIGKHEYRST